MRRFGKEGVAALLLVLLLIASLAYRSMERHGVKMRDIRRALIARQNTTQLLGDSDIVSGSLSNGLQYFLQSNSWPEKRVELRLVVNAGSVLETDEQRGLAHAVEHMLFRGTKHFPARAIDEYFQSIGMRSGQDLNAWTSRDQTVYTITVPSDRAGAIDTAIAILADMAHAATFDPTEARTEAGIVFEEWRSSRVAGARLTERRDQLLLAGSKYATREPIGDTTVLRKFDPIALRSFYDEWYRPELIAVVVVGDIDPIAVRKTIRKNFDAIPSNSPRKVRPATEIVWNTNFRAATLEDPEATSTRVSFWFPHKEQTFQTATDYRDWVVSRLWHHVLDTRLEDVADTAGSPLLWTDASTEFPVRSLQVEVVSANVVEGSVLRSIDLLAGEIARLKQHGLTARELSKGADQFLKERWQNAQSNPGSDALATSYVNQFMSGNVVMNRRAQYNLAQKIVPTITLDEIQRSVQLVMADSGVLVLVTQPTGHAPKPITDAELVERARVASNGVTTIRSESADSIVLISTLPTPGRIVTETFSRDIETFDIKLSNGLRVLAKPSAFNDDNIEFRLVAPGGASLASDADFSSALLSDDVIASLGIGPLSGLKLDRVNQELGVTFDQHVSDEAITLHGDFSPHDLDRFFEILHLTLTAPREDSSAFRRYRERALSGAAHLNADPDNVFEDSSAAINSQHSHRSVRDYGAFLKSVSLSRAMAFWKQRMSNASGFTLVMVGSFQIAQLRPLLERYVASLPAGVPEQPRDDGVRFPAGVVNQVINVGAGPRAKARITLSGPVSTTVETSEIMNAVSDVAERVLGDKLREKMGGTYGVDAGFTKSFAAPATYRFTIDFEAAPERIDSLANAALTELARLSTTGPTQHEFDATKAALIRDFDNTAESNTYWAGELSQHALLGWSLASILTHQQRYKDLTLANLREASAIFLNPTQHVRLTMFPQQKASPTLRQPH